MTTRIAYRALAGVCAALPLTATVADLAERLGQQYAHEPAAKGLLLGALVGLPAGQNYLHGLEAVARALKRENERFDSGVWLEWALEGK